MLLATLAAGIAFWRCLPEPLFDDPASTILLDRHGELLGARIAQDGQWRFPYQAQVPEKFKTALIHFEDKRFYSHPGVDPLALARAVRLNIGEGRVVSGASTLSMQVIRLARHNPERSYLEKLKEMILALRLELRHDKDEVLALYAANAPFGGNVVGLQAAAWRYFGRDAAQLSWAESATLAVLPNSPALIHPGRNRARLKQKRDALLHRLNDEGLISALDLELALLEPLPAKPLPLPRLAPHLMQTLAGSGQYRYASTLDKSLQGAAQQIVRLHSDRLGLAGIHNAAALIIDNRSFEVRAYVGNSRYSAQPERGYAVDIVHRPRSTGSILKPLLFAAMIEQGEILPNTLVPDIPTQYAGFMPENYDRSYRGAVPAREALARSLNVPAVRMLRRYGLERFYDFLNHMGMSTLHRRPEDYGLTLILGGAEGTLWDLGGMYANLAVLAQAPGDARQLNYRALKVLQSDVDTTERRAEISPAGAWLTLQALLEVSRPGAEGFWRNFSSSRKVAWKTGTSYGLRDAWAIGSDRRYTVAVWVGNADGEGRPGLSGLSGAAPILFDLFNRLETSNWFERPAQGMKKIRVCADDGFLSDGRCESIEQWVPEQSHFARISPNHVDVHLDKTQSWRVHGDCESVHAMVHKSWFILPPAQAYYYRRGHANYRALPPLRRDCRQRAGAMPERSPIALIYPPPATRLYIPIDLNAKRGRTVFDAAHNDANALLYWHLDEHYLGSTRGFHQMALDIGAGRHRITLVDEAGNRLTRVFEVLDKGSATN